MDTICDCCGLQRDLLPFTHDYDDGTSEDYCQECYDAGCDRGSCMVIRQHKPGLASIAQAPPAPSQQQRIAQQQAAINQAQAQAPVPAQPNPMTGPPMPTAAQAQAAGVAGLATPPSATMNDLMKALAGDNPVDEKAKEDKPKKPPVVPSFMIDASGEEAVIADVSTFDDGEPRLEVHKLSPLVQDGKRRVLDGSSTQGLSISQCGINQESRSHGWFVVNSETQNARIERGEIPVCEKCFPPYVEDQP